MSLGIRHSRALEQGAGALLPFGMFARHYTAQMTPAAPIGQWDLQMRTGTLREATAGSSLRLEPRSQRGRGVFFSYIGLFSYYNFEQLDLPPSFVSSNTPCSSTELRVHVVSDPTSDRTLASRLAILCEFTNNRILVFGGQILWNPEQQTSNGQTVFTIYSVGQDNFAPARRTATTARHNGRELHPIMEGNPNCSAGFLCRRWTSLASTTVANLTRVHEPNDAFWSSTTCQRPLAATASLRGHSDIGFSCCSTAGGRALH